jgi:hypothetical protein
LLNADTPSDWDLPKNDPIPCVANFVGHPFGIIAMTFGGNALNDAQAAMGSVRFREARRCSDACITPVKQPSKRC